MSTFDQQFQKVAHAEGFVAALDQSGGSTPRALRLYGMAEDSYSNDEEMFALVHQMRTRIITSPSFDGNRVLAAILFENTLDREIEGQPTASYLWQKKNIVPFLKVDKGLEEEADGVQLMKPIHDLSALLQKAKSEGVFGTKMRSVIKEANAAGIARVVDQQFEVAKQIVAAGLVPIIEPEIDVHSPTKAECEALLKTELLKHLDALRPDQKVMLKLTLPEQMDLYKECIEYPCVVRVVALSGGYSRDQANSRLVKNTGVIASFSRALSEGLLVQQTDEEFNATLDAAIESIFQASRT